MKLNVAYNFESACPIHLNLEYIISMNRAIRDIKDDNSCFTIVQLCQFQMQFRRHTCSIEHQILVCFWVGLQQIWNFTDSFLLGLFMSSRENASNPPSHGLSACYYLSIYRDEDNMQDIWRNI
jgi:hypothetical protein